jgi:hypothetical protein
MTPIQAIKDQMINRGLPYFVIIYNGKEVDRQDDRISPGEAADQLEAILNNLNYNSVTVQVSGKNKEDKGNGGNVKTFTHVVSCRQDSKGITGHTVAHSGGIDLTTHLALIDEKNELQREIDRKDEEIRRLKEEVKKVGEEDKTLAYIEKFGPIISGLFGTPVGKARSVSQAVAGTPEELSEQLAELMERWAKADKRHILKTVEAIVLIAENEPKKYKTYQTMLLS